MESENTQSTLYFIGIIIKLTSDISQNEFNTITAEKESFRDTLKALQNKLNIKCKYKNQTNKNISKIDSPSIIYDNDNVAYLLANFNHEQVLIQRFGNHPPELWSMDKFIQMWSGKWLQVKTKQSQFDITWFKTEFLKYKYIIASVLLFSFILQILALVTPIIIQVIMDKVLVHNSMMTLDLLIFGLIIAAILEVTLKGLREYVYNHTVNRIDMTLGLKLVNHLLHLPLSFFKTRQIGAIVTRVKELETIREFLTGSFLHSVLMCSFYLFFFMS